MQAPLVIHPGSGFHRQALALLGALSLCASCAAPRRAPLCDADVAASVAGRATSFEEVQTVLALNDAVPLMCGAGLTFDPAEPGFWETCAFLYEPDVRKARRRLEAKRALARGAGAVPSIDAGIDHVGTGDDRETEAMATLDLLALFGLGPAAAAKELARAEVCEALAELEAAAWAAQFRVTRARIRLTAALEREREADRIANEASEDDARITTLERAGRGAPAEIAWARASIARGREMAARARLDAARAREELAVASGLPPDHPALSGEAWKLGPRSLGARRIPSTTPELPSESSTDPGYLLRHAPRLRLFKLRYAVAEARVRGAAAATWPNVALGPKLKFVPDDVLAGGILDVSIPLPRATRAALCAAIIERTAAKEALEDELARVLARNRSLNAQMATLVDEVRQHVWNRREGADRMWEASRARFRSDESALGGWGLALEMRVEATMTAIETGEAEELLDTEICEAVVSQLPPSPAPAETRPQ